MKLSPIGASALLSESATTPMHSGILCLFDLPKQADIDFLLSRYAEMCAVEKIRPPFNQKLKPPRLPMDLPGLIEQTEKDFSYHSRHLGLPWPGDRRQLAELVGRLHAIPLNQARPLWECCLIEGLQNKQFAMYFKTHQALFETSEVVEELLRWFSTRAGVARPALPWAQPSKRQQPDDEDASGPLRALFAAYGQALEQVRTVPGLTRALTRLATQAMKKNPAATLPYSAPNSMLNVEITGRRELAFIRLDADRLSGLTKRHGVDRQALMLSVLGGMLRVYLSARKSLPSKPLIARTGVTTQTEQGADASILVSLATHESDPLERLTQVSASLQDGMQALSRMTSAGMQNYQNMLMWPYHLTRLAGVAGRIRPMFNLIVTDYPGQKSPLYLERIPLTALYPIPALGDGHALHIGLRYCAGSVDITLTGCADRVPGLASCAEFLERELAALEA